MQVETHFGVKYPDLSRVVRSASEEIARETAAAYPGAVVVSRLVTEWLPLD